MTPVFSYVALLDLLAFVQGTLLGVLLILKGKEHISYLFLGLFLFSYSSELIVSVLADSNVFPQRPELIYLPVSFYFLFMPCLFLYVKSMSGKINWKKYTWLFLPVLLEVTILLVKFIQPSEEKLRQYQGGEASVFYEIYVTVAMVYAILYAIVILRQVANHRKRVKNFHSNSEGKLLNWVKWICFFIIAINLLLMTSVFFTSEFYGKYIYPVASALNVAFIFWVALSGFKQNVIELPEVDFKEKKSDLPTQSIGSTPEKIAAPIIEIEDTSEAEYQAILNFIEKEKVYIEPDLHLADLAQKLHISQRYLSELINKKAGVNFNQFINQFRIAEAKELLLDEKFAHLNVIGIAYEVGFNSKTTFYTVFKNEVGMTPAKFQKQRLVKSKN